MCGVLRFDVHDDAFVSGLDLRGTSTLRACS